jgi:hypothetical protein
MIRLICGMQLNRDQFFATSIRTVPHRNQGIRVSTTVGQIDNSKGFIQLGEKPQPYLLWPSKCSNAILCQVMSGNLAS